MAALPGLYRTADQASVAEAVNRLAGEYNRADRFAPIYAADTGTGAAYAITPVPGVTDYNVGQAFIFKAANANTGTAPTLNVNGLGAGTITYPDGSALAIGDIPANAFAEVICTATTPAFQLQTASLPGIPKSLLTTRGDMLRRSASAPERFALGAAGTLLKSDGTDPNWFAKGSALQYLRVNSGATDLEWATLSADQVVSSITGAVATGSTTVPTDDTIPQSSEGDQYLSLSITPKSSTSTLVFLVVAQISNTTANNTMACALFQDAGASAIATTALLAAAATGMYQIVLRHSMTSGTTSATTFKVRIGGGQAGTTTFNGFSSARYYGGSLASGILIAEFP